MANLTTATTERSKEKTSVRMRKARVNAGLAQREAAAKMGVGQSRISNYENEFNKNVPPEFLKQCASVYGCSLEYLYGFTDEIEGGYAYKPIEKDSAIAIHKNVLTNMGLSLSDLREVTVSDDAMSNEFTKGTRIIISNNIGNISKPAIYAIEQDGQTVMRGLRKELSGHYTLFVHNKQNYDDQTISEKELSKILITGKYIGHWRTASN